MDARTISLNVNLGNASPAFQFTITFPHGAPTGESSAPIVTITGATQNLDPEKREYDLKQQLFERKVGTTCVQSDQRGLSPATPPPSSVPSDRYSADTNERLTDTPSDLTMIDRRDALQLRTATDLSAIEPSRRDSVSQQDNLTSNPSVEPGYYAGRVQTPPGSPPRRSTSPSLVETPRNFETGRGRELYRDTTRKGDDGSTSRSRSASRSLSREDSRASPRNGRASRGHSPIHDSPVVEMEDDNRAPSRSPHPPPYSPRSSTFKSRQSAPSPALRRDEPASLRNRIGDQRSSLVSSRRNRHPTCPFFHPGERDKHALGTPHPGYSPEEFEEAVQIHEKGEELPQRLIKAGVQVNISNRGFQASSPTSTRGPPEYPATDRYARLGRYNHHSSSSMEAATFEPSPKRRRLASEGHNDHYRRDMYTSSSRSSFHRGHSSSFNGERDSGPPLQHNRHGSSQFLSPSHPSTDRYNSRSGSTSNLTSRVGNRSAHSRFKH